MALTKRTVPSLPLLCLLLSLFCSGCTQEPTAARPSSPLATAWPPTAGVESTTTPPVVNSGKLLVTSHDSTIYLLMYHHFVEDPADVNDVTTTTERFRADLQWLKDNGYTFLLPRELVYSQSLPEKGVMITIDDGYASCYHLAYPILQELEAKAVISLIVSGQDAQDPGFLSWDMCREMAGSGLVEFGSHTCAFHRYDPEWEVYGIQRRPDEDRADYEARIFPDLRRSIDVIQTELGQEVLFFAYPHGKTDPWAEDFIRAHFAVTATTQVAPADLSGGFYELPRYNINTTNSPACYLPAG